MLMVSGHYRTEKLASHWSNNTGGYCQAPSCKDKQIEEDLEHILTRCPALDATRAALLDFTIKYTEDLPQLHPLTNILWDQSHPSFCQLLLDCSVMFNVITSAQLFGPTHMAHLVLLSSQGKAQTCV